MIKKRPNKKEYKIIVIGASLGGLNALTTLLQAFPPDFAHSVVIVQHREKDSPEERLIAILQRACALPVNSVEDKQLLKSGQAYIAPPDYHLQVDNGHFSLSVDEPVNFARPSIDVLFESAATVYGEQTIGVLLTGASADGSAGLFAIKKAGGLTVAQDPSTAEATLMPKSAIELFKVDHVLPLEKIGDFLVEMTKK